MDRGLKKNKENKYIWITRVVRRMKVIIIQQVHSLFSLLRKQSKKIIKIEDKLKKRKEALSPDKKTKISVKRNKKKKKNISNFFLLFLTINSANNNGNSLVRYDPKINLL